MPLDSSVGFLISNTGRKLNQLLTACFQPHDITSEQWSLLSRLAEGDGISQKELALRADKDPTNVTRILDQLERKKLVRREANLEDRRSFQLYVTEQGRALDLQLAPIEAEIVSGLLAGISAEEIKQFQKVIAQINDNADKRRHMDIRS